MICYAELHAEFNLTDLNKFMENFAVFELEKKVENLQNEVEDLKKFNKNYQSHFQKIVDLSVKIALNSRDAEAYNQRGIAYGELKNYQQAIEDFTQAINLNPDPDCPLYYIGRAHAYSDLENYEKAIEDYNKAIEINPNSTFLIRRRVFLVMIYKILSKRLRILIKQEN